MSSNPGTALSLSSWRFSKPEFRRRLLAWYERSRRELPWRASRDPYRIWLSEIMLQQTRVEAVLPYFDAFLRKFPDVASLASAPEGEVLALWSGLGYYSRARNLQRAARSVADCGFPGDYAGIRALPGVGDYTAAAIASIAFALPHAAVDGNVLRVIARVFNDAGDIGSAATKRRFQVIADELLDRRHPGEFNQAMMELGATVCIPRNPKCEACPVKALCGAREAGRARDLPIKLQRAKSEAEAVSVAVVMRGGRVLMRQRPDGAARMPGFWEAPEVHELPGMRGVELRGSFRHTIVNTVYSVQVHTGVLARRPSRSKWIDVAEGAVPITTVTRKAIRIAQNVLR